MDPQQQKQTSDNNKNFNLYEYLYRNHTELIFVMDTQGKVQEVNPICLPMLGLTREETMQMSWQLITNPNEHKQGLLHFKRALQGETQIFETQVRHKDGHFLEFQITQVPILQEGTVVGVFGIAKNITARKREQERLRHAENLYKLISENVQDIITYSTPTGVTQYVSPAIRTLLGYEPDEVIGQLTIEFWHPDDLQRVLADVQEGSNVFECRVKHKAGHWVWFETSYQYVYDDNGKVAAVVGVGRDISHRKQIEEQLRRSESSLAHAQRLAQIGHWDWDIVSNDLFWSCDMYRIFGLEPGEFGATYEAFLQFVHPEDRPTIDFAVQQSLENGAAYAPEYRILRSDGSERYIRVRGDVIRDETGSAVRMVGVSQDVTERKRAEELFLQSEKLTLAGQLAAGIAHEIRNPLTALKGFLQLMMHNKRENEEHLNVMYAELNRVEMILSELLVLAKPQAKLIDRHDLAPILYEVLTLINTQAILNNIEVVSEIAQDLPMIACNPGELKQVFLNFLKNSIESMPRGGRITVSTELHGPQSVRIRFADQGCGIPRERLARLGEPFYTTKEKGTGLGFMVSKKIIEHHQGHVHVSSEVNVGTTIDVILPVKFETLTIV